MRYIEPVELKDKSNEKLLSLYKKFDRELYNINYDNIDIPSEIVEEGDITIYDFHRMMEDDLRDLEFMLEENLCIIEQELESRGLAIEHELVNRKWEFVIASSN